MEMKSTNKSSLAEMKKGAEHYRQIVEAAISERGVDVPDEVDRQMLVTVMRFLKNLNKRSKWRFFFHRGNVRLDPANPRVVAL